MKTMSLGEIGAEGLFVDGDWVETKDQDPSGEVRLTQLADVGVGNFRDRSDRWLRTDQAQRLNCTLLQKDDILIARMPDPIGRACLVPDLPSHAVTAVDVAVLRVSSLYDPRFIMWMINAPQFHERVVRLQSGTTRKRISRKNLATLQVPTPDRATQRRIVEIVEDHLSHLDAADASLALAERRAAAFLDAEIDVAVHGVAAPSANIASLLAEPMRNGRSDRAVTGSSGTRTLTLTAVTKRDFSDRHTKITSTSPKAAEGLWLRSGDVLVQRSNTPELVGTSARYDGPEYWAIFPDLLIRLRADESRVDSRYMALALRSRRVHRALRSKAKGLAGSMPKIDQATIGATLIPLPDRSGQDAAVERASTAEENASRLSDAVRVQRAKGVALRRAVLAAAFSGRLTGASTDSEVIEEMAHA